MPLDFALNLNRPFRTQEPRLRTHPAQHMDKQEKGHSEHIRNSLYAVQWRVGLVRVHQCWRRAVGNSVHATTRGYIQENCTDILDYLNCFLQRIGVQMRGMC